jgi:hypothetical protein
MIRSHETLPVWWVEKLGGLHPETHVPKPHKNCATLPVVAVGEQVFIAVGWGQLIAAEVCHRAELWSIR